MRTRIAVTVVALLLSCVVALGAGWGTHPATAASGPTSVMAGGEWGKRVDAELGTMSPAELGNAWASVAVARLDAGDIAGAIAAWKQAGAPNTYIWFMVATRVSDMDDLKAARTTSDGIPDSQARIQAYLHLATTLAQRGQVQESLSTVAAAVDLGKSTGKRAYDDVASVGYGHVAAALAAGGHLKEARAAMEHVDKGAFRIGMTMLVRAAEIALSGDDIAAMAAKEKLDLGGCREALAGAARTKALAGDMKDARRIIGAIPSGGQRVVALVSIAIAQRQAGDAKAALATLAEAEKMCDVAADELANPPAEETPVAPASKATTNMWAGGGGGVVRASATTLADWAGACAALADAYAQAGELAAARNRLDACLEVAEQHASRTSGPSAAEMLRPTTIRVLIARGELGSAVRAASDPKQGVYPTMCATIARAYVAKGDTDGLEKFIKSLHTPQQRVLAYVGASMAKPAK